jgi:hypothetical protein
VFGAHTLFRAAAVTALLLLGIAAPTPALAAAAHITAQPDNVMVNTMIRLKGRGFPAHQRLSIAECGAKQWVVMASPCDTDNTIRVKTDGKGRFTTSFKAEPCPRTTPPKPPITQEHCFIGNPRLNGIDTDTLVGAVGLTVTYP